MTDQEEEERVVRFHNNMPSIPSLSSLLLWHNQCCYCTRCPLPPPLLRPRSLNCRGGGRAAMAAKGATNFGCLRRKSTGGSDGRAGGRDFGLVGGRCRGRATAGADTNQPVGRSEGSAGFLLVRRALRSSPPRPPGRMDDLAWRRATDRPTEEMVRCCHEDRGGESARGCEKAEQVCARTRPARPCMLPPRDPASTTGEE